MQIGWTELDAMDPRALVAARNQAHHAVQWVTRLSRANLPARPGDHHSNLGWHRDRQALVSHELAASDRAVYRAGLRIDAMTLFIAEGATAIDEFALDSHNDAEAGAWLDGLADRIGLRPATGVVLPYQLPPVIGTHYTCAAARPDFVTLARWFDAGDDILQETRMKLVGVVPGPSPVRCWPHHFDMATLLSLASGDPETAPSIGIGMSPGDDFYAEPYFYISPWPAPPVDALPNLPKPGHWHTDGFVGAVATAHEVLTQADRRQALRRFIDGAVTLSRDLVKA